MKKIWISLFLMFSLLLLASCDLFYPPEEEPKDIINEVELDDKSILLKNGVNQISIKNPTNKILCTLAFNTPSTYPSKENAFYSIQSSFLEDCNTKGIGDKEKVPTILSRYGMDAELFYESTNIKFFFLSGGGYTDTADATKAYYQTKIPEFATVFEQILKSESNLIFGHDYVDVDENGYFSVYLVNAINTPETTAGFVYSIEATMRDIFYVNTNTYEYAVSTDESEAYEERMINIFAHELFHYMDEQARLDLDRSNHFMYEGMATFVASLMEKELGLIDDYGNRMFANTYLYHPMKSDKRPEGFLQPDYDVGCDFWAYIWNFYGADKFKAMIPYHDTIEAVETVLDKDFKTVYRDFVLSVLGSVGQPVEGHDIFPDAELYQLEDSWSLLLALTMSLDDGSPTSFIGGSVKNVETEIAPLGFDVKVWYDNPDILTVNAEPGVEIYAFTAEKRYLDYLSNYYEVYQN